MSESGWLAVMRVIRVGSAGRLRGGGRAGGGAGGGGAGRAPKSRWKKLGFGGWRRRDRLRPRDPLGAGNNSAPARRLRARRLGSARRSGHLHDGVVGCGDSSSSSFRLTRARIFEVDRFDELEGIWLLRRLEPGQLGIECPSSIARVRSRIRVAIGAATAPPPLPPCTMTAIAYLGLS